MDSFHHEEHEAFIMAAIVVLDAFVFFVVNVMPRDMLGPENHTDKHKRGG